MPNNPVKLALIVVFVGLTYSGFRGYTDEKTNNSNAAQSLDNLMLIDKNNIDDRGKALYESIRDLTPDEIALMSNVYQNNPEYRKMMFYGCAMLKKAPFESKAKAIKNANLRAGNETHASVIKYLCPKSLLTVEN